MFWLGVALAGAAGAALRLLVDHAVTARAGRSFPYGILVVNVSGAALAGAVAGMVARGLPPGVGVVLAAGFCGAYTTVSTLLYDTVLLFERGSWGRASANLSTLTLSWLAAAAGWVLVAA